MNINMQFVIYLLLSLSMLFFISFSYGILIKKYTNLKVQFYFPFGFLIFLGLSYFLSFPFVYFKWSSKLYYLALAFTSMLAFLYASWIFLKEKSYKNFSIEKCFFAIIGIIFITFAFYQTTKYTIAPNAFDSVYYNTFVTTHISKPHLGWWYYMDNIPLDFVRAQYDFSSYYYIHSFTSVILKNIFPSMNELFYAPLFMWQATISLSTLIYFSVVDCFKLFFPKKNYLCFLCIFSIIALFYGSMYFNTALAFIGNSYRPYIVAYLFIGIYSFFNQSERSLDSNLLFLMLINAALIAVSSSGFFISAFIMYGLFYSLFKKEGISALRIVAIIAFPTILFLFAFLLGNLTLIITPTIFIAFYLLPSVKVLNTKKFEKNFIFTLQFIIPGAIILSTVLFHNLYDYTYDYFFFPGSFHDMVWNYFDFSSSLVFVINIILLVLVCSIIINKEQKNLLITNMIRITFITFLNPFVIPFTIKFLTDFVFYRAFDIFFNPFMISFSILVISTLLAKNTSIKRSILLLIPIPFFLFGMHNYTQYYHHFFMQAEDYNFFLKQTNSEFDVLSRLNEIIKENKDTRPIVASQITHTIGFTPNVNMPYSLNNLLTRKSEYLTVDQTDLLNIMIYSVETSYNGVIDGKEPDFKRAADLMIKNNVKYAIINKNSFYYDSKTDEYYYLFSILHEEFEVLYANEKFVIYIIE